MQSHKEVGVPPHIAFQGKYGPENRSFEAFFFLPFPGLHLTNAYINCIYSVITHSAMDTDKI